MFSLVVSASTKEKVRIEKVKIKRVINGMNIFLRLKSNAISLLFVLGKNIIDLESRGKALVTIDAMT